MKFPPLIAVVALMLFQTGCAGLIPQITQGGSMVRTITPGSASIDGCRFLGSISARGVALEGGMTAANTRIRNAVAEAGGNAMVVTDRYFEEMGSARHGNISVDAYNCPRKN